MFTTRATERSIQPRAYWTLITLLGVFKQQSEVRASVIPYLVHVVTWYLCKTIYNVGIYALPDLIYLYPIRHSSSFPMLPAPTAGRISILYPDTVHSESFLEWVEDWIRRLHTWYQMLQTCLEAFVLGSMDKMPDEMVVLWSRLFEISPHHHER